MSSANGESERPTGPLELSEVLHIQTNDGTSLPFEVVGILEDPDEGTSYAVLLHEPSEQAEGQFIVTDLAGNLVENEALAQEVVDDFLVFAEDGDDGRARNGETN